jgi:3-phosphoshikimate 1-carboxyvinyltransferase
MNVHVKPGFLKGSLQVPGSKSHTIRSVLLATLAGGRTCIENPLASGDGLSALAASRAFGAIVKEEENRWVVQGRGGILQVPSNVLDTGNSGTTTCLFTSVASLVDGYTVITGDEQIRRRPILPLVDALNALGATAFLTRGGQGCPPVVVKGVLQGGTVTIEGKNSQYVSSLLLSAPLAKRTTVIQVVNALEKPYVQLTLDWMKRLGIEVANPADYTQFVVEGGQQYQSGDFTIPSDWSAVAFPLVAAAITRSDLVLTGLDFSDSQGDKRVVDILARFGANVYRQNESELHIVGGERLKGGLTIDLSDIPDALPALSVLATQAEGRTVFVNLEHVRQKETDRVAEMTAKLNSLGSSLHMEQDSLVVDGPTAIQGGIVSSSGDHRFAMALVAAGLAAEGEVVITDAQCADVSFPGFFSKFAACGAGLLIEEAQD